MKSAIRIIAVLALLATAFSAAAQDKVVYHFDGGLAQATKGLRNIRNHLDIDPTAKIIAVAHAEGVDFLMEGAKTAVRNMIAWLGEEHGLRARVVPADGRQER